MSTISVTLDQSTSAWTLQVSTQEVQVTTYPTTITWELSGNASSGTWPTDAEHPAFKWLGTSPPPGTFTNPNINGVNLSATDNGGSSGTSWSYQLCILMGGKYYYSPSTTIRQNPTAPKIKNQ